jgi:uncharacterized phage-associated protein
MVALNQTMGRFGPMITALEAAKYLLTLDEREEGDVTSNLKLQKLLYYAQGLHLALHDEPLFEEAIHAWQHGPVVPSVYRAFKKFGAGPIEISDNTAPVKLTKRVRETLDEVHTVYGQFSAWRLREMTHNEPPWSDAFEEGVSNIEITHKALKRYFKTRLA